MVYYHLSVRRKENYGIYIDTIVARNHYVILHL